MSFEQTAYRVDEDDGPAQPVLVLSNPSSTNITVEVFNTDGSATGEYYTIFWYQILWWNNNGITNMLQEEVLIMDLDHTLSHFLLEQPGFHLMFQ